MKLSTREAPGYFAKPDPTATGLLIYGADAMRVALRRQEVIKALIGENGEDEMRLTTTCKLTRSHRFSMTHLHSRKWLKMNKITHLANEI